LSTPAIAILFLIMVAAPCVVAVRSARRYNDDGTDPNPMELDAPEDEPLPVSPPVIMAGADAYAKSAIRRARGSSLQDLAYEAEADARAAQDRAEQAHWASLIAQARAAAIRADAAAEVAAMAGRAAEKAIFDAEFGYLPVDHPSLDFPRSRVRRTAA
jgi:hypothetical protein